jgi:hypothetical protein
VKWRTVSASVPADGSGTSELPTVRAIYPFSAETAVLQQACGFPGFLFAREHEEHVAGRIKNAAHGQHAGLEGEWLHLHSFRGLACPLPRPEHRSAVSVLLRGL